MARWVSANESQMRSVTLCEHVVELLWRGVGEGWGGMLSTW